MKPKVIALYLPQYHPTKENDEWWGKGFTEWTNVGKSKPLFKGHDQPRVPTDLGYYDLRLPEVREQQVRLAQESGVTAFCYWHYWFGNGKRLLSSIFEDVLSTSKPDFPFCLAWANHSWYAKSWNKDIPDKLLMEQTYPGAEDAKLHFDFLLNAFKDPRYFKVDGKPFFYIFDAEELPKEYLEKFHKWSYEAGLKGIYIVANSFDVTKSPEYYLEKGYDAVVYGRMASIWNQEYQKMNNFHKILIRFYRRIKEKLTGKPRGARDYGKDYPKFINKTDYRPDVIPQIVPQWDHSPRSGNKASTIYYNSTPKNFYLHVKDAINAIRDKEEDHQILLLKSWNEWGEGNYMEPDLTNGKAFIKGLRKAIDEENNSH
jgi:glycosyltransferase, group 2 family